MTVFISNSCRNRSEQPIKVTAPFLNHVTVIKAKFYISGLISLREGSRYSSWFWEGTGEDQICPSKTESQTKIARPEQYNQQYSKKKNLTSFSI